MRHGSQTAMVEENRECGGIGAVGLAKVVMSHLEAAERQPGLMMAELKRRGKRMLEIGFVNQLAEGYPWVD